MSDDCPFCAIVAGRIPSTAVADRERVYAFRDIAPAAPTHVLIVPKEHVADVRDVTAERGPLIAEMIEVAHEVAAADGIASSGYRLIFNVGPDAGQTVFHLHLHVLGGRPLGPMGPGA
jgi:histidine triad (HIT) family protein